MPLTIELPSQKEQTAFNLRRWAELIQDPEMAKIQGKVETDRHGYVIMIPSAIGSHGGNQFELGTVIKQHLPGGKVFVECPISTSDGVKVPDVAWISHERLSQTSIDPCFSSAPEICVEVLSPSNTRREIAEKIALYFDAGAEEVWTCSPEGKMAFYLSPEGPAKTASRLCPGFPSQIETV
ncbi:MAG TPA: Uma2 family endonuclease [Chthoniobacterales bacterium]